MSPAGTLQYREVILLAAFFTSRTALRTGIASLLLTGCLARSHQPSSAAASEGWVELYTWPNHQSHAREDERGRVVEYFEFGCDAPIEDGSPCSAASLRKRLSIADAAPLLADLADDAIIDSSSTPMCWSPRHGVVVRDASGGLMWQASICFECDQVIGPKSGALTELGRNRLLAFFERYGINERVEITEADLARARELAPAPPPEEPVQHPD